MELGLFYFLNLFVWQSELTVIWANVMYCAWWRQLLGDILGLMAASVWLAQASIFAFLAQLH